VDEKSSYCWTHSPKQKSDVAILMVNFVKNLAATGKVVKYIRCDNAGENTSLQQLCMKQQLNIQFEYSIPGTPQVNGKVERKFATLYNKVRAMLNSAGLVCTIHIGLGTEAAKTATDIENLIASHKDGMLAFQVFHDTVRNPNICLNVFGDLRLSTNTITEP
jgi:hypothetical protein